MNVYNGNNITKVIITSLIGVSPKYRDGPRGTRTGTQNRAGAGLELGSDIVQPTERLHSPYSVESTSGIENTERRIKIRGKKMKNGNRSGD